MKSFIINGNNFSGLDGFFDEVEKVLTDGESGFGKNFDAFNDVLRGGFGKFEYAEEIELFWKNSRKSQNDLEYPETVRYLTERLNRTHRDSQESVRRDLEAAKNQNGLTLYDIILEIIWDNSNVKLKLE
jgi:RNAse (barnase) inhibitor barstar